MEDANIYQGNISQSCPFLFPSSRAALVTQSCFSKTVPFRVSSYSRSEQDQAQSSQCVTLAMKPDSGLRENEFKSRMNYSPHWNNRGVSVISLIPATCSGQPNALAPPACFLPDSASFHQHPESFPLPLSAYSRAKHGNSYLLVAIINRLF